MEEEEEESDPEDIVKHQQTALRSIRSNEHNGSDHVQNRVTYLSVCVVKTSRLVGHVVCPIKCSQRKRHSSRQSQRRHMGVSVSARAVINI